MMLLSPDPPPPSHPVTTCSQSVRSYHFLFVTENLTNNKYPQPQPSDMLMFLSEYFVLTSQTSLSEHSR